MIAGFWAWACLVGLWGFLACTVGFILQGFPARGVFDARRSAVWGGALLVFFAVWMVAMAHA